MKIKAKPFAELDSAKQADGLIPAVIQDDRTLQVLMLGYMNREAYEKSLTEGRVTFYSRTRGCLWTKGETSGNYLDIGSVTARPATRAQKAASRGPRPKPKASSVTSRA